MRIAVIGAGPTGLAAAYALSGRGANVVVFESTSVSGGMARTVTVGVERIEAFYHHIFTSDEALVSLAEEIGLGDRLEWLPPRNALYSGERLYPFTTPGDLLRLGALPLMDRIRLGLFVLAARRVRSWEHLEERTAREWAVETGGKRVYETIWKPLLASKFGDYADQVGATWLGTRPNSGDPPGERTGRKSRLFPGKFRRALRYAHRTHPRRGRRGAPEHPGPHDPFPFRNTPGRRNAPGKNPRRRRTLLQGSRHHRSGGTGQNGTPASRGIPGSAHGHPSPGEPLRLAGTLPSSLALLLDHRRGREVSLCGPHRAHKPASSGPDTAPP